MRKINAKERPQKRTDSDMVIEKNKTIFNYFTNFSQFKTKDDDIGMLEYQEETLKIGALTDFNQFEKNYGETEQNDHQSNKKEVKIEDGLTLEELEEKKLETFRNEKKQEMDELVLKMKEIKSKAFYLFIQ